MKRPNVLVNVAMTADGKIDSIARQGAIISSFRDTARVDRLRADSDAVLVGGQTLLDQDPRLTVKTLAFRQERKRLGQPENPAKVGVVSIANLKLDSRFMTFGPARRLIYTTSRTASELITRLKDGGAEVFVLGGQRVDLTATLESLADLGIRKLLVEGGGTLIAEFFRLGVVDELMIYIAPKIFGGISAPSLAGGPGFFPEQAPRLQLASVVKFDDEGGILTHYMVEHKE
jgi:2,5-diamino-6-(ribosylamino)-4(3H)-pyrimidinone 5'-phosphate reductase